MSPFEQDGFGTVFHTEWNEVVVPEPVPYTPQTAGWVALGALLVAVSAWAAWKGWRRWTGNAYRRDGLAALRAASLSELPVVLKRTALQAYPRAEVASLSGVPWAAFLDRTCPGAGWDALGDALATLTYRGPDALDIAHATALRDAAAHWVRAHRA